MHIFFVKRSEINRAIMINVEEVLSCERFPSDAVSAAIIRFTFRHGDPVYVRGLTDDLADQIWAEFIQQASQID